MKKQLLFNSVRGISYYVSLWLCILSVDAFTTSTTRIQIHDNSHMGIVSRFSSHKPFRILQTKINNSKENKDEKDTNNKVESSSPDDDDESSKSDEQQLTLFGLEKNTSTQDGMQVPIFTGIIVLIANLILTGYGFYVFFSGNDPLFNK